MKQMWAPWRIDYILDEDREDGCIFCKKAASDKDEENLIVHRADDGYIMMNKYPYNNGHLLVIPYKHVPDICELSADENSSLTQGVCRSIEVLRSVMKAEGFNIGINLGAVAGSGMDDHVHYHVVPRWNGDTNIMPVLADVKVIPEHLRSTYRKLKERFSTMFPVNS